MKISEHFQQIENSKKTHSWTLVSYDINVAPIDSLTISLADKIMELRCIGCPHHYEAWKKRKQNNTLLTPSNETALKSFIKPIFGLPNDVIPVDHLEGGISQYLWYFLILEISSEAIVRVERPGFAAIDHGGDGMVIHRLSNGDLMFRLWEIKKCTGAAPVSSTINTAYNQLNENATEYLARYTTISQELPDAELSEFYGKLIDLWIDAAPEAAVGVSVAINKKNSPNTSFTTFGRQFPKFISPKRLRGMLTAIDNFEIFSNKVQQEIWKGL